MAKKEIEFASNPFDALLGDAKKASSTSVVSTPTTLSTPSVANKVSTPRNQPLSHKSSHVQMRNEPNSQKDRSDFRYGEVRSKAAPPHKFIKKTYEMKPENRSLLVAISFMKRMHLRDTIAEALATYFALPENQRLLRELKRENPEKYEFIFGYQMDAATSSTDEKNSS